MKEVKKVSQGCVNGLSRKFQECFKKASKVFQEILKGVSRKIEVF